MNEPFSEVVCLLDHVISNKSIKASHGSASSQKCRNAACIEGLTEFVVDYIGSRCDVRGNDNRLFVFMDQLDNACGHMVVVQRYFDVCGMDLMACGTIETRTASTFSELKTILDIVHRVHRLPWG